MPKPTVEQVLQQIWTDPATKQKLEADPKAFIKDFGIEIPENMKVELHEDSPSLKNFVLPKIEGNTPEIPKSSDPVVSVFQRAMTDPAFKSKLLSDPKTTVRDMGVAIPDAVNIRVYENSADTLHLVLPANPGESELSDADLEAVAGGVSKSGQLTYGAEAAGIACGVTAAALAFTVVGAAIAGGASAAGAGSAEIASTNISSSGK